jgi:agmatinase
MTFDPNAAALADSGIFGLTSTPDEATVVLIPVPFEATTSYGSGTALGPSAILEASKQVDLYDIEYGKPYEAGIVMLPEDPLLQKLNAEAKAWAKPVIAAGGLGQHTDALTRVNAHCREMNRVVFETAQQWLEKGKLVGVVGGDHSTPFGLIEAVAHKHPGVGILHLDAHADLRDAYEGFTFSHASIMHNVATRIPNVARIVQIGIRDFSESEWLFSKNSGGKIHTFFDTELSQARLDGVSFRSQADAVVKLLPHKVYLSFDIDGLEPTLCPHTGTPVPGGLSFHQALGLLAAVIRAGKEVVGFDLNEVAPGPDGDEWDGNVGARLLYKMIGCALRSLSKTDRISAS